jgi:hypothetical protein
MEAVDTEHAATPTLAISSAAVRLVRRQTGQQVTGAQTFMQDDLVTILIRQHLDDGIQRLIREELVHTVETALQRRVLASMSSGHSDPDLAVETFLLAPR